MEFLRSEKELTRLANLEIFIMWGWENQQRNFTSVWHYRRYKPEVSKRFPCQIKPKDVSQFIKYMRFNSRHLRTLKKYGADFSLKCVSILVFVNVYLSHLECVRNSLPRASLFTIWSAIFFSYAGKFDKKKEKKKTFVEGSCFYGNGFSVL